MSILNSLIKSSVELCLYDFVHPSKIPNCASKTNSTNLVLDRNSPEIDLIYKVQEKRIIDPRFDRGEKCYAALVDERITSYIWSSRGSVGVDEINMAIKPSTDEVYLYDAFTIKKWRGNNLYPSILQLALENAEKENIKRTMIFVGSNNTASRKGVIKAGFKLFQTLYYKRFLFFTSSKLSEPIENHSSAQFIGLK
ncbi:MAG: hypothetical protein VX794_02220 [Nitrospinota bacterium]|nr:hypothetical protein [Nitrospinota bacterium]